MTDDLFKDTPGKTEGAVSRFWSYAPAVLTLIAALLLSIEYLLRKTGHGGLCPTAGCALVGTFVKYGEMIFIGMGMFFFWTMTGLLLLGKHIDRPWVWVLTATVLNAGLAFDGGILGFQKFGIQEPCILCYSVGVFLFLILAAFARMRRSLSIMLMGAAVWGAGFASQSLFEFPERTPELRETVLTTFRPAQPNGEQIFFFFSLRCEKCAEVITRLSAHPPLDGNWHLISPDTKPEDRHILSSLLIHPLTEINPFSAILVLKDAPFQDTAISPISVNAPRKAAVFMRNSGYFHVPLMLVQETPTRRVVLEGPDSILNYLLKKGLIPS